VIVDDFYSTDDDVRNPAGLLKKNEWLFSTLFPAMAQGRPTSFHFQGTAVSRDDVFEKLRDDPTVTSRTFRAVVDWDKKEVLWPELVTFEKLMLMRDKRMGSLIFAREMQNERLDPSSSIISRKWLYPDDGSPTWEYDPAALRFDENLSYAGAVVALDPSIGSKVTNDYSGYALIIKAQPTDGSLARYYIEDVRQEHHSFQQRVDQVKSMINGRPFERPVTRVRVESIAGFMDVGERVAASVSVPCELVDRVANKLTSLERRSALFENRRVFLNKNIAPSLREELTYQLCTNSARHDDVRDAVLLALDDENPSWESWV